MNMKLQNVLERIASHLFEKSLKNCSQAGFHPSDQTGSLLDAGISPGFAGNLELPNMGTLQSNSELGKLWGQSGRLELQHMNFQAGCEGIRPWDSMHDFLL